MQTAVVTGGAGFIGSYIAKALVEKNYNVRIIDNLHTGKLSNLSEIKKDIKFVKGNILNKKLLSKEFRNVDYVFHEAALRSVFESLENPLAYNSVNVAGTLNVLEAAKNQNVKRVIFAASSSVYGSTGSKAAIETRIPNPTSPYAISKLACEYYLKMYYESFGLETVALRYFNVFGPLQDMKSDYATVIPIFTNILLKGKTPTIFGNGSQTRDFTFIQNVVEANLAAMKPKKAAGEVFNVGNGKPHSVNYVYKETCRILGKRVKPKHSPMKSGDDLHRFASISKARKILKWKPAVSFNTGLEITVNWFREKYSKGC